MYPYLPEFRDFGAAIAITLTGGIGVLATQSRHSPTLFEIGTLALAACFLMVGYYCSVATMRVGDVTIVSSFRYTAMLWAIAPGRLFFRGCPRSPDHPWNAGHSGRRPVYHVA